VVDSHDTDGKRAKYYADDDKHTLMDLVEAERFGDKHDYDYELLKNMRNVNDSYDAYVFEGVGIGTVLLSRGRAAPAWLGTLEWKPKPSVYGIEDQLVWFPAVPLLPVSHERDNTRIWGEQVPTGAAV
jgi:hypothetical protein